MGVATNAEIKAIAHNLRLAALAFNRASAVLMEQVRQDDDDFLNREPVEDPFVDCRPLPGEQQATE